MDASGHIAAPIDGPVPQRRLVSLRIMAFGGAAFGWLLVFAIVASVLVATAREAVRDETQSALRLASAAATLRLPTAFERRDLMAEARHLAAQIDAMRHVTAELRDAASKPVALVPDALPVDKLTQAPGWFARLIQPEPASELIPVTQYPNLLGMLEIRTDPQDEINEAWRDLRLILPLLAATALVSVGVTMAITALVLRRLAGLGAALDRMRAGALDQRAPPTRIAQLDRLGEGVNALAVHLADERAENRHLQSRMMTLAEAERARIASDLHDGIGPQLFALQAAIAQANRAVADRSSAELHDALGAVAHHAGAIRQATRAAIDDLRLGPTEGAGLDEMVQELLIEFADMAPETRIILAPGAALAPDPGEAGRIAVFRFVRESVLNALRHAAPSRIEVALLPDQDELTARVSDDGTGPASTGTRGLGQTGMRDRAAALNGHYRPPRREGGQTITEFRLPCPKPSAQEDPT
ncbi:LapD/MoxY N-terminal periplasmic domain-containing protein [Paracoccus lutimaris]|uniref:Two-component system sensor histidine kinase UhpB n=1 Tax=Paracoccus lutimaris TaxID=1490030 RepID=A0A368YIW0_9RHOB|nr:LapD/MoxY N-terminal periplasmic domain-containing protein [Paracoccus lutimaris]RCW79246.1 two-component system sensor histidine kinase UhpB [Paracoccus lutimaris]